MKEVIGVILVIIGILGFVVMIAIGVYTVIGWIGVAIMACVVSLLFGMALLDDLKL